MAEFIPAEVYKVTDLAAHTERGLQEVERMTKKCTIPSYKSSDASESSLFVDNGVLKFYNNVTGVEYNVTLT